MKTKYTLSFAQSVWLVFFPWAVGVIALCVMFVQFVQHLVS